MKKEITQLLAAGEGETLEFKRDTHSANFREKFGRTVCAFANGEAGGVFVVGVEDNGAISGYRDTQKDAEKISNWLNDWVVSPKPAVTIESESFEEGDVIVIKVQPSPHATWFEKKMWIRVGKTTREASLLDMRRIEERSRALTFDAADCASATLGDLSQELYSAYQGKFVADDIIAANGRTFLEKLTGQGFANLTSEKPTYAGMLFCGLNPQRFLPLASIIFVRTSAESLNDRSAILDEREIKGDLPTQARELESLLRTSITNWNETIDFTEKRISSYPLEALRELMLNALMHRDYAIADSVRIYWFKDRVEIKSPGGLLPPARPERFPNVTVYRNPIIAAAMKNLGLVEKFGNGVERAQAALKHNGNPPAEFELEYADSLKVTLRGRVKPQSL